MFMQKLFAILFIALSFVAMAMGEATIALLFIPAGICLLCSKRNWIDIN